jgi:hypothetical protein
MAYMNASEKHAAVIKERTKYEEVLSPFVPSGAPSPFTDEGPQQYRERALPILQNYAPNYKDVKLDDARGTAFDLLERQIFDDARREARHPTNIPDGELRQVISHDETGRPSYSFYGSPRAWMNNFAAPRKQLVGIMSPGVRYVEVK